MELSGRTLSHGRRSLRAIVLGQPAPPEAAPAPTSAATPQSVIDAIPLTTYTEGKAST